MSESSGVEVRELTREECEALLQRQRVGRLAYLLHNQVEIVPIHYVYADGFVYARSALGQKLLALRSVPWVAFEVDEIESFTTWTSVVVRGGVQVLDPEGPPAEVEALRRAIQALRTAVPDTLRAGDPAPERNFVLRIAADRVTGRASAPAA